LEQYPYILEQYPLLLGTIGFVITCYNFCL
jgi:hypothetical protein